MSEQNRTRQTVSKQGENEPQEMNYYVLFANYTHGLALKKLLDQEKIPARIAPAPRAIQGELSCGMSLLVKAEHIDDVRDCIERNQAEYHEIVELPCQIRPHRNKFC